MSSPLFIILALVPIGVAFRYLLAQEEAAKLIGMKLATPEFLTVQKSGHQTAVSPPEANKWFFLSLALLIGGVVWLWFAFGWLYAVIGAVVAFATVLPRANSRHFLLSIFGSMSRRYADYVRDGDTERAEAMKYMLGRIAEEYPTLGGEQTTEKVITKSDVDYIFSLDRAGWESYVERMVHPDGWQVERSHHETGTVVGAFDRTTSMGLSTQPLYSDATSPPKMLVVTSYYPLGKLGAFMPTRKAELEKAAQDDLGSDYTVTVRNFSQPLLEGIELQVMRSGSAPTNKQ